MSTNRRLGTQRTPLLAGLAFGHALEQLAWLDTQGVGQALNEAEVDAGCLTQLVVGDRALASTNHLGQLVLCETSGLAELAETKPQGSH